MSSIPISPFSDFLSSANDYQRITPASDYNKRLRVCLVSPGLRAVASGPLIPVGYTGAGLLGILDAAHAYGVNGPQTWPPVLAVKAALPAVTNGTDVSNFPCNVDSGSCFFRTPEALILALNRIHENANDIIRIHLPQTVDSQGFGIIAPMDQFISGMGTRNKFKFLRDYLFPGTYTGDTGGILPVLEDAEIVGVPPVEDYQGNGITGAFAVYDDPSGTVTLSRTGLELLVAYELLLYGVVLIIAPSYNPTIQNTRELNLGIDCYITLAQSDNIVGVTSASGDNRSTFGSLEVSYQSGNTFNFTHGCSSGDLVTIYNNIVTQGNFLQQLSSNALLFHNGLSGANFNLTQKSANGQYTDLFRLPVLDGITGSYQNSIVAGLTAIKLNDAQLSKIICVAGYKERDIFTTAFGGKLGLLNARIPLTVDAIGALARAKAADAFYSGLSGLRFGKILNPGTLSMALAPSDTANSNMLKSKRINYYVASQQGFYLGSDYVGVTGAFNNSDRVIIPNLAGIIETEVRNLIEPVYVSTNNKINNPATRANVTNDVINAFTTNNTGNWPSIRNAIDLNQLTVTCDGTNNTENSPMLNIDIEVFPLATSTGTDISQSFIGALTVRVTLGG